MATSSLSLLHTIKDISQDKGGVPITVVRLLETLAQNNPEITIQLAASPGNSPLLDDSQVFPNFNWSSIPERNNRTFRDTLIQRVNQDQDCQWVIHDHGIWLPCNHAVAVASRRLGIPRVVSPHGMLEPWAWQYKPWKKRLAWLLFQSRDLKTAQVLHATAKSEAMNLRRFFPNIPIAVVPLGIDLPPTDIFNSSSPEKSKKTILFLSRIHEKKGLLNLVEAWAHLRPKDWTLMIAGPNEKGYQEVIDQKIRELNLTDTISFPGEVVGKAKWKLYCQADLFVLPTLSENFGIVVAEALACQTPVITTKGAPWSELEAYHCGWWIDIGVTPLVKTLQQAMSLSEAQRTEMGQRGRMLIESKYSWEQTTKQMLEVYNWVLGEGKQPSSLVD